MCYTEKMNDRRLVNGQNRDAAATAMAHSKSKLRKHASMELGYVWLRNVGVVAIAAVMILVVWLMTCDRLHATQEQVQSERLEHYKTIAAPEKLGVLAGLELSSEDEADESDPDGDGLNNATERELGTDPYHADTDLDGLPDGYEVNVSKTDPLKADTDGDSLLDGDELDLGLNPLLADSLQDGVQDSERQLQFATNNSMAGVELELTGRGNLASTTIDVYENPTFANTPGLLGEVYNFSTRGELERATVKVKYDPQELAAKNLDAGRLTLYYFDEQTNQLELVPTEVNLAEQTLTAQLTHFSRYVVGDRAAVLVDAKTDVMFVIDNSVSMYSNEQMEAAGYEATGAVGNDTEFKRLTLTNRLIDRLEGNYRFGVSEFLGDYSNLLKFSSDYEKAKKAVDGMNTNWTVEADGTDITRALEAGIAEFSDDQNAHYMILLTDGKDTSETLAEQQEEIIQRAEKLNVKVCVIGLGSETDAEILDTIAEGTGCDYYSASDSAALDEIYNLIGANINYNYVDTDGDGEVDGMIVADSGFITNRDGFSFANFTSNKSTAGHCYGMATFAMLRYMGKLPVELPERTNSKFMLAEGGKVKLSANSYDLSETYFMGEGNLYDFKFTSPGLVLMLQEDLPDDYRDRVEDDVWMIKKDYYDDMLEVGADFTLKDWPANREKEEDFSRYQSAQLQINSDKLTRGAKKEESALLDAIWRLFIIQLEEKSYSFDAEPDKAYNSLVTNLQSGVPVVFEFSSKEMGGGHATNAVRLIQDLEDADLFKLEIYDNNHPGVPRYVSLKRKKFNKIALNYTAWTNEYSYVVGYDFDDDGTWNKMRGNVSEAEVR